MLDNSEVILLLLELGLVAFILVYVYVIFWRR